ncbi:hypothetical protein [Bacteroides sp. OF04-15BH]|uniref:hypothetical protein n=1 Tax=Bacteroides sp. OF04-15BH TaxID=2292281 RepID=UPI000E4CF859|nr:hypothetical protein [Bacteroides sp. OF04-15BH]RHP61861.1 hypothetical protein DXA74_12505 [Bacteroides sp. OF04-15BH]
MEYYKRTWILCLMIVAALMGLHFLPRMEIFGMELRRVDLLSDLFPDTPDVSEKELAEAMKQQRPHPAHRKTNDCPKGMVCIEDYATDEKRSMDVFYRRLMELNTRKKPVRIAYFGDSFIEGDIFTADLRDLLQSRFGGAGVGFVDMASQTAGFRQTVRAYSQNVESHSVMDSVHKNAFLGINCRYFFPLGGQVSLTLKGTGYGKNTQKAQKSQLFLKTEVPLQVTAEVNDGQQQTFDLKGADRIQCLTTTGAISQVKWSFYADSLARRRVVLYGATMDNEQGVVVDNFSLRGSGGGVLLSIPDENLKQFFDYRPYNLIVLHYGLNVVGPGSGKKAADNYGRILDRMIRKFQALQPGTPILVVSVSDRNSRDKDGKITTIGGIRYLVNEQQQAAVRNGVAFWNLFEAMGGTASIKRMAEQKPALANKDYTHLNFRGGKVLAEKLYEALVNAVKNYTKENQYED